MSVIQDALRRKLDEQRAEGASAGTAPAKPPPQTPPLAQQVLLQQQTQIERAARARSHSTGTVVAASSRERSPATTRRDDRFTIWLLVTAILVMMTAAFMGALMYFVNAPHLRLTSTVIQPAPTAPEPAALEPEAAESAPLPTPTSSPVQAAPAAGNGWPSVHVGGVLTGGPRSRVSAILNGRMVKLMQQIDGVRLVSLSEEGVTLEFEGHRRFVETGQHIGQSAPASSGR